MKIHSGTPCAVQSTARGQSLIAMEMWYSTHPKNFGNHVTVHRESERPSAPPADQCKITQSTGMATFRKKKQQHSRVFFGVIFYVYTNVDKRERARASY